MPGRKYSVGSAYRYGFNGKEKDNETYGNGNEYDYGDRIYNPRISRWLSLDPLQKKYPNETPYFYTGGNPILFADPDGRDRIITITLITDKGQYTLLQIRTDIGVFKKTMTSCYIWGEVKVIKENITESYTIDISKRTPSYNPPLISHSTSTEFVNSYLTNIVSYGLSKLGALDFNDPNAKAIPQNFGFVEVGGDGTTIELGGSDAKNKEVLDLSGILGAANASKDLGEGFPNLIELLRKVKGVSPITKLLLQEADAHEKMASAAEILDATMTSSPTTSSNNTKQDTDSNLKNATILFCRDCNFPYEKNKKTSKWNISYTDKPVKDTGAGPDHTNPPVK